MQKESPLPISSESADNSSTTILPTSMNKQDRSRRFPDVLFGLLEDAESMGQSHIISWLPCGLRFRVHDIQIFSKTIMPQYFNHTRYKSFLRQLSLYEYRRGGWRGTPGPTGCYDHPFFQRGRPDLLDKVIRVKDRRKCTSAWSLDGLGSGHSASSFLLEPASPSMTSTSESTFASRKYLDPTLILRAPFSSNEILDEIVNTFGNSSVSSCVSDPQDVYMRSMNDSWTRLQSFSQYLPQVSSDSFLPREKRPSRT